MPPSGATPPPPPPPLPGSSLGAPPAGYVAYSAAGPQRPVKGLGMATITMYRVVCVSSLLTAIAVFHRKSVVQDILDRGGQVNADDIAADNSARSLLVAAVVVGVVLMLAAGIVTAVWSHRVATNAVARGARDVKPGMAAGGWFIPFGMWFLGWRELQRSVEGVGSDASPIKRWQMAFIGASVFSWFTRNAGGNPNSLSDLGSTLSTQFILFLLGFALYVLAMVFATKAIRHINEAVGPA